MPKLEKKKKKKLVYVTCSFLELILMTYLSFLQSEIGHGLCHYSGMQLMTKSKM
jgi:hypothetical protein